MEISILIVEDESLEAMDLALMLEARGYRVAGKAASHSEAIAAAAECTPDLIIMDITIPGEADGIDAAAEISRNCSIPVVFVTAHCDAVTIERALKAGSYGYLLKPYDESMLYFTVESALSRYHLEQQHIADQKFLTSILSGIDDAVIAVDKNGHFAYVNEAAENMTGLSLESLVGKSFPEIINIAPVAREPDQRDDLSDLFGEHYTVAGKDGSCRYVQLRSFTSDKNRSDGSVYMLHDITGKIDAEKKIRSQYEQIKFQYNEIVKINAELVRTHTELVERNIKLKESEERFSRVFRLSPVAVAIADCNGFFVDVNDSFLSMTGYPREQIIDRSYASGQVVSAEIEETIRATLTGGETVYGQEFRMTDRSGSSHDLLGSFEVFTLNGVPSILVILVDVTEKRIMMKEIRAEKERLAVTLQSIADGVIASDSAGRVLYMNAAAERLTGITQENAFMKQLDDVYTTIHERDGLVSLNPAAAAVRSGRIIARKSGLVMTDAQGRRISIADSCSPIRDADGGIIGTVLVVRDVTEIRRTEREIMKAEKLESLGVLAGGIAHDFNNLLTAIIGNISLALSLVQDDASIRDMLMDVEKASFRARDLTHQLLTFSKGGAPMRKSAAIGDLVRDTAGFVLTGSNICVEFSIPDDLPTADIDEGQISQVIHNLVLNAKQAMSKGGVIKISAEALCLAKENAYNLKPGDYIRIEVADQGPGIPDDIITKIFDPYFTTKETGSGLGLASSYSVIHKHEGHISAESVPGKGSTFTILIPSSSMIGEEYADDLPAGPMSGTVVFLDDDESIGIIAGKMLSQVGITPFVFSRPADALACLKAFKLEGKIPSAVIMDLTIPGMKSAVTTQKSMRKIIPGLVIIISSGYSNNPVVAEYKSHGFDGVIQKPYRLEDLASVLSAFCT